MSTSVRAAQSGLDRIEMIMNQKTLKIHPDKSCYRLAGSKTNIQRIREEIAKKPLKYKNFQLNEKVKEKWLGDQFHQAGLDESVKSTIKERIGRIKLAIFETNSIMEDVRIMVVGGVLGAIDIWELALLPSKNWIMISDDDIKLLEDVQELFLRYVFAVPTSVPKPAACWDTALMMMKLRIMKNKLTFVKYLSLLNEDSMGETTVCHHSMKGSL